MKVETKHDILSWYERQPRILTDDFVQSIEWDEIRRHAVDDRLIPVLLYMRDVETLTDMYFREMRRTPTGRDAVISKFMERWGVEEVFHGEVLNRFLNECGVRSDPQWQRDVRRSVSPVYKANTYLITSLTNLIGSRFTATHMTFGAIHEMTTAQSYRQLIEMARHPVLTKLLTGIIREEAAHTQFYWRMARLELRQNKAAQKLARRVIDHFWKPVGQGSRPRTQTEYTVSTLFGHGGGIEKLDKTVTRRVGELPGFDGFISINHKLEKIFSDNLPGFRGTAAA
ncbi:MAG TPA: acyl-ACP desaturase [Pyrinomonadaceae bacterium]|nr:acyl-ACP desaturase [Pyrinomonadaceae bacterium]